MMALKTEGEYLEFKSLNIHVFLGRKISILNLLFIATPLERQREASTAHCSWPFCFGAGVVRKWPSYSGGLSAQLSYKIPLPGRLKSQKLIFSQFWRLWVQEQGVTKLGFWWSLSSWFAGDRGRERGKGRERDIYLLISSVSSSSYKASQAALMVEKPPANRGDVGDVSSNPGWGRSLEEAMATHSSILAWIIPRIEKPGGLQSIGSKRVGHNWSDLVLTLSYKDTSPIGSGPHPFDLI